MVNTVSSSEKKDRIEDFKDRVAGLMDGKYDRSFEREEKKTSDYFEKIIGEGLTYVLAETTDEDMPSHCQLLKNQDLEVD